MAPELMEQPESLDVVRWAETLAARVRLMQSVQVQLVLPQVEVESTLPEASQQGAPVARQMRQARLEQASARQRAFRQPVPPDAQRARA